MKQLLKIYGDTSSILSVNLGDVLKCFKKNSNKYMLLWIDGIILEENITNILGFNSVIDFEKNINKSKNGRIISLKKLNKIDSSTKQILNLLLISDNDFDKLKRFKDDIEMYNQCSTVIELVDGTYWEIYTNDDYLYKQIIKKYGPLAEVFQIK